jgi:hypothetical protein
VRSLLDAVLVADPSKRLNLQQVKDHPWVANGPASPGERTPGSSEKVSQSVRSTYYVHKVVDSAQYVHMSCVRIILYWFLFAAIINLHMNFTC